MRELYLVVAVTSLFENDTKFCKVSGVHAADCFTQLIGDHGCNTMEAIEELFFDMNHIVKTLELSEDAYHMLTIPDETLMDFSDWVSISPRQMSLHADD